MFPLSLDLFGDLPKDRQRSPLGLAPLFLGEVLEASEPMVIGKHEWAVVICRCGRRGVVEAYVWRRIRPGVQAHRDLGWQREEEWPTYDHNRWDNGLPLTLQALWLQCADARRRHGIGGGAND